MSQYDTQSLHDFLIHTPESGLRKMLVDKKTMTDVHCNLLIKIAKSCSLEQFAEHFENKDFPKVRMSPAEIKIKEKFWQDSVLALNERGLLQPIATSKVAA